MASLRNLPPPTHPLQSPRSGGDDRDGGGAFPLSPASPEVRRRHLLQ
jgi:hypothetical protein